MKKSVCVLLSSYNGEKYIAEQIESLLKQKDVDLKILVRDDGSQDSTVEILESFKKENKLDYFHEENVGFVKSFYLLVKNAPEYDYYAFCDQDDVWDDDKLISAITLLEEKDTNKPALCYTALRVVDKNLKFLCIGNEKHRVGENPFQESFMINWVYGCTCVFNNSTRNYFLKYDYDTIYSHDVTVCKVVAGLGSLVYDPVPHINYRQHGKNFSGFGSLSFRNLKKQLRWVFKYEIKNLRLKEMRKYKQNFYEILSEENKEFVDLVCNYKNSRKDKKKLLKYKPFKSDKFWINLYLRTLIRLGKF